MSGQFFDEQRQAIDALRMTDQDHEALVAELDRSSTNSSGRDKRRSKRLPYKNVRGLTLELTHPGGSTVRFVVKPRNISRTGLSVLHGGFIHTGTPCIVPLRSLTGKTTLVGAKVVMCRHIRGRVHELGMVFDQPIELTQFVLDADAGMPDGEHTGPITLPTLQGSVLVVDEWESDRKLIDYDLQKLGLRVTLADGGAEALGLLKAGKFDVVITGDWLGDMSGPDLAGAIRKIGRDTPLLGIFVDAGPVQMEAAAVAGIGTIIAKPYKIEHLAQLLLQYLNFDIGHSDGAAAPGGSDLSTKWLETGMRPMILSFLQGLEIRLADLERQVTSGGADPLATCQRLKGAAASYGFPKLSDTAEQLARLLQNDAPLDSVKNTIERLGGLTAAALSAAEQDAKA